MKKMALCVMALLMLGFAGTAFAAGKAYIGVQKWECHGCKQEFYTLSDDDPMKDEPNKEHKNWLFKSTRPDSYIGECPKAKLKNKQHIFAKKGSVVQTHSYDFAKNYFSKSDKFIVFVGKGRARIAEWKCDFCEKIFYSFKGDDLNKDYNKDIDEQRNHLFALKAPDSKIDTCEKSLFESETHLFTFQRDSISESSFQLAKGAYKDKLFVIK